MTAQNYFMCKCMFCIWLRILGRYCFIKFHRCALILCINIRIKIHFPCTLSLGIILTPYTAQCTLIHLYRISSDIIPGGALYSIVSIDFWGGALIEGGCIRGGQYIFIYVEMKKYVRKTRKNKAKRGKIRGKRGKKGKIP